MKVTLAEKPKAKKSVPIKKEACPMSGHRPTSDKKKLEVELEEEVEQKVKRVLSPEHIQKLVEGRRKKLEKKKLEKENPQSLDS